MEDDFSFWVIEASGPILNMQFLIYCELLFKFKKGLYEARDVSQLIKCLPYKLKALRMVKTV